MTEAETKNTGTTEDVYASLAASVAELRDKALEASAEREAELQRRIEAFAALSAELNRLRDELGTLEVEEESLPVAAYKANMGGDTSEENALRARYRAVLDRLPGVRSRISELENELPKYYDRQRADREGVDEAVRFRQRSEVRPGAPTAEARAELTRLRQSILETIDAAMWACSPDNSAAVARKHGLEKNREEARRILRS